MELLNRRSVTTETLNNEMSFEHVVYSHGDGTVSDVSASTRDGWAPEVIEFETAPGMWEIECTDSEWELLSGWSGQYGYSGPGMHASEFLGGALAQHIIDTPGLYAATVPAVLPLEEEDDTDADTWVIAHREVTL